jgi:hypothetical protein
VARTVRYDRGSFGRERYEFFPAVKTSGWKCIATRRPVIAEIMAATEVNVPEASLAPNASNSHLLPLFISFVQPPRVRGAVERVPACGPRQCPQQWPDAASCNCNFLQ